jgi:hypothetical protein
MIRPSRSKTVLLLSSALLFAVTLIASPALAQVTSGTIFGTVKDPTGAMVQDASVTIANPANGITRTVTTGSDGAFVAPNLYPGTYNVAVEAKGFKKLETTGIVLSATDKLSVGDFVLAVGTTSDEVTVTADAGQIQLQTSSGERSDLITSKQLNDVAMNGSNVLDYMKLIPGVVSSFDGHASGTGGLDSMNINGTRANQHEFTIDGASNVDTGNNGGTHVTVNTDAIEEVKILNSNYQAEFGKAAGGQIAIVTKGGTDQFHGDVSFIHRNEGMNANNWFASQSTPVTPKAFYRYNFTGYTLGGPVIIPGTGFNKNKGKLFFFWSQEFYSQKIPQQGLTQFYTPTAAERQGDFSSSVDGNGNPIEISGPGITNNKIVPSAAQQAVFDQVQKILNLFPLPNITGNNSYNYQAALSGTDPRREDILRIDYQLNGKNRLFGRWIHNTDHQSGPFGSFGLPCSGNIQFPGGCTQNHPGWNFSTNLVSTITPTVLNEFSVGPSHTLSYVAGVNGNVSRGVNGITLPLLVPVKSDQSIPDMSFGGLSGVNFGGSYLGATPWHQANTTINVNDNLTWVRHNHTLKAGLFYQRNRKDQIAWGNINGQFNFSNAQTSPSSCPVSTPTCALGDPLASALLGDFSSFGQSTARPTGYFRYNQLEFYVQDTWKITSRLTLDYGMRFAWIPPQYDAKNQIALFDPSAYKAADAVTIDPNSGNIITADGGNPLNGIVYTKNGQLPAGGWGGRGIMPEPRLGFAFDLLGDHKTILRGGAGMMHDRVQGNLIFNTVFNNPAVVQSPSVSNDNIANLPTLSTSSAETPVLTNVLGAARDGKVPTVYSFSLGVQHEIGRGTTLDIAYVGTMSRHLVTSRDINAMPYGAAFLRQNQDPNCVDNQQPTPQPVFPGGVVPAVQPGLQPQYLAAGYDFNGFCAFGFHAFTSAYLLPYKGYGTGNGGLQYLEFNGTSNYNSLQVSLQRRFSRGLTFGVAYTWSKSLTTANSDQDVQDTFNALLDYRAANWDRTHVFAANYVYDLPNLTKHFGGPKWLSYLTDNYQLSGVTQFMTGTPIDFNNGFGFPPGSVTGSDQYGAIPFYLTLDQSKNVVLPTIGPPKRGTRDILRAGGMQNWDMSLFKNIKLGSSERRYLQLRGEAFNIFNHPNFQDKNYNVSMNGPWDYATPTTALSISKNSNWGTYNDQYSGVGGPRVVQLAAKFYF